MSRKNKESPQIDKTVAKAVNFEVSVSELARRSEKRAWMVAVFALVVGLAMTGVVVSMQPLKEKVPYVVVVDPYTGNATTSKLAGDYGQIPSLGSVEALNRGNIAQYVIARETWDYATWELRDWEQTFAMSTADVAREYSEYQNPNKNPSAPLKEYGRDRAVRIRILSIIPSDRTSGTASADGPGGSADVRFQRSLYDKKNGTSRVLDSRIVRLEYVYNSELTLDDQRRHLNPLGFQIISYRVEGDFSTGGAVVAPPPSDFGNSNATNLPNLPYAPGQQQPGAQQQYPTAPVDPNQQGVPVQPGQFPQQVPAQPGQFPQQQVPAQQGQFPQQQVPAQPGQFPQQPAQPQQAAPVQGAAPNQANGASF